MKRLFRIITIMVALSAASLVLVTTPAQAHTTQGYANDGYCAWDYSYGINGSNRPEAWSARRTACKYVDADITSYYQRSTLRSTYCPMSTYFAYCQGAHNNAISNVNVRVRAKDWEWETWQTLYKFHG